MIYLFFIFLQMKAQVGEKFEGGKVEVKRKMESKSREAMVSSKEPRKCEEIKRQE